MTSLLLVQCLPDPPHVHAMATRSRMLTAAGRLHPYPTSTWRLTPFCTGPSTIPGLGFPACVSAAIGGHLCVVSTGLRPGYTATATGLWLGVKTGAGSRAASGGWVGGWVGGWIDAQQSCCPCWPSSGPCTFGVCGRLGLDLGRPALSLPMRGARRDPEHHIFYNVEEAKACQRAQLWLEARPRGGGAHAVACGVRIALRVGFRSRVYGHSSNRVRVRVTDRVLRISKGGTACRHALEHRLGSWPCRSC